MQMIESPEASLVMRRYYDFYYPEAIRILASVKSLDTGMVLNTSTKESELDVFDQIVKQKRLKNEIKSTEREVEIKNQKFEEKVKTLGENLREQRLSEEELKRIIAEYQKVLEATKAENAKKVSKLKELWYANKKYVDRAMMGLRVAGAIIAVVAFLI
jgi:hypothetical protein